MNKARKRRQRRKERDLRWVERGGSLRILGGSHRYKKVYGLLQRKDKKPQAFWCQDTDDAPRIARLYHEAVEAAQVSKTDF